MKILVLNGPNINMLGIREPELYGRKTYKDLCRFVLTFCRRNKVKCDFYQSNYEGKLIDKIQAAYGKYDGIVFNPAAYTHTSVALFDALKSVDIPTVEVHLTDVGQREDFRKISYIRPACVAVVGGKGFDGYTEAVRILLNEANK